jgi:arsenite methyltransferase
VTVQLQFDDAASRHLEAIYQAPTVAARRQRALALLDLHAGDAVLDIGTGPGFLAAEIASEVGPSGRVSAIDRSREMLARARHRCAQHSRVTFHEADAEALPFPAASFDAAAAVQVYEYVSDIPAALYELYRVLRPGGRAVIVDIDWASMVWEAQDRARATRVFHAWEEHLTDSHLPRRLSPLLRESGFDVAAAEPCTAFTLHPEPFVEGLARLISGFVPGHRGVTAEDAAAWLDDLSATASTGNYFFSLTAYLFLARRPPAE